MTVHRIQGSEVEYGISVQGQPQANPMVASTHVVNSYASANGLTRRPRWDYEEESPLRDARGFDMSRENADASQLTDEDLGLANIILTNGARLYVDHAHPEYASPETTSPLDVVRWEKAGELVMAKAAQLAHETVSPAPIVLYKNNIDNKGASYGAHENYLVDRQVPFRTLVAHLTSFFVSRQILCGSGRVGRGQDGNEAAFQISQRADYIETEVGLETTLKRPIINTRDEPHADPALYRRLHVIIGDANLCDVSIFMKHASTSLMLAMIEADAAGDPIELADPVRALHEISHDPSLQVAVELADGSTITAIDLQWLHHERATRFLENSDVDEQTRMAMDRWASLLHRLGSDPMSCAGEIDWITKLGILNRYRERDGLDWSDHKLHLVDLQYHDIRPERGLHHRLAAAGRIERLVDPALIAEAVTEPPHDTRAYFRGKCLERFSSDIAAASWDSVVFDLPGQTALQRIPTMDPRRGTALHVAELFERCDTAEELFSAIAGS